MAGEAELRLRAQLSRLRSVPLLRGAKLSGELERPCFQRGLSDDHRLAQAGGHLGLGEPLGVGAEIEEAERVVGAQLGRLLDEAVLVDELADPVASVDGEVVAAVRTDAEMLVELVVAVVRPTPGAGVRMRPAAVLRRRVPVLDRDVDPFRHPKLRV